MRRFVEVEVDLPFDVDLAALVVRSPVLPRQFQRFPAVHDAMIGSATASSVHGSQGRCTECGFLHKSRDDPARLAAFIPCAAAWALDLAEVAVAVEHGTAEALPGGGAVAAVAHRQSRSWARAATVWASQALRLSA
jgi:hypothetical protein